MATDSNDMVIMGKCCRHFSSAILIGSVSYKQVMMTNIRAGMRSIFGQFSPRTMELAALESKKKSP